MGESGPVVVLIIVLELSLRDKGTHQDHDSPLARALKPEKKD